MIDKTNGSKSSSTRQAKEEEGGSLFWLKEGIKVTRNCEYTQATGIGDPGIHTSPEGANILVGDVI